MLGGEIHNRIKKYPVAAGGLGGVLHIQSKHKKRENKRKGTPKCPRVGLKNPVVELILKIKLLITEVITDPDGMKAKVFRDFSVSTTV